MGLMAMLTELAQGVQQKKDYPKKRQTSHVNEGRKMLQMWQHGHFAKDPNCPAKDKKCNNCGKLGHFRKCCKTKDRKREDVRKVEPEYAFNVHRVGDSTDRVVLLDGYPVNMIIDSRTTLNIIDKGMWQSLKQRKIRCLSGKNVQIGVRVDVKETTYSTWEVRM